MRRRHAGIAAVLLTGVLGGCMTADGDGRFEQSMEEASALNARLGASYLQMGDLREANEKLRKALEQDPDNADAHATYGLLQMRLDKPEEAEHHFERALDLDPENPEIRNNLATMLCERGDYDRAIELFVAAAEDRLYRTPEYAYANAGTCARDADRLDEARAHLRRALEANPNFRRPLLELADLEHDARRADRAADYLERYHEARRYSARSLWLGVRIERMRGNQDGADAYGRRLVRNFPDSDQADEFIETR